MDFFDFTPDTDIDLNEETDIVSQNNGAMRIRRSSFGKKVRTGKRNMEFWQIMDSEGGMPEPNEVLMLKSNGLSDTGAIFFYLLQNRICEDFYLSTWIINRENIELICKLLDDGRIHHMTMIISDRMRKLNTKRATYTYMLEEFGRRNDKVRFRVVNCHAKTFSAKFGDDYYTVTGSGNWTYNPRIEHFQITNDKEIYQFNKEWMTELI